MNTIATACNTAVISATLGLCAWAHGSVVLVPQDHPTIQKAIDLSPPGTQILVAPGDYVEDVVVNKAIILQSTHGAAVTRIIAPAGETALTFLDTQGTNQLLGFTLSGEGSPGTSALHVIGGPGTVVVELCVIRDTNTNDANVWLRDGAVVTMSNTLVCNNIGWAAIEAKQGSLVMLNCTVAHNQAASIVAHSTGETVLRNCIVWGNDGPPGVGPGGSLDIAWSNVQGALPDGIGNMNVNPMFVDAEEADFRLSPGSPAVDSGNTSLLVTEHSHYPVDLLWQVRAVTDPQTPVTGITMWGVAVDMGAFEYQPPSEPTCAADLNGDSTVDVSDLLQLLRSWGVCP